MKRRHVLLVSALLTAAIASYLAFRAGARAGEFTTLSPVFDGTCTDIGGMPGSEDMVLDRERRILFVSSDDRRAWGPDAPRGAIHALPFDGLTSVSRPADMTGGVPQRFHPHGVSLYTAPDGARTLMVVNHPQAPAMTGTTVEIYGVADNGTLAHRRTVAIDGLTRINDVAATGPDSFYATSETDLAPGSFAETASLLLTGGDRTGAVWFFDGTRGRKVADGIGFANSPALSPDGTRLYVSGTLDRALHVFNRNRETGDLTLAERAFIGSGLDNLDVEPDGRIWVGSHPKLFTWLGHARDRSQVAPLQVLVIEPAAVGEGGKVDQVLLQDGSRAFSGAAVAVRDGPTMVMGSVFDPGIRVCTLPEVWKQSQSHPAQRLIDPARDDAINATREAEEAAAKAAAGRP
jgi:arylesterase / paraoxonase